MIPVEFKVIEIKTWISPSSGCRGHPCPYTVRDRDHEMEGFFNFIEIINRLESSWGKEADATQNGIQDGSDHMSFIISLRLFFLKRDGKRFYFLTTNS